MKKLLFIQVGLLLIITSTSVLAEWEFAAASDSAVFLVDKSSIRKKNNLVKMWEFVTFDNPQKTFDGKQYITTKRLKEYDCANETVSLISIAGFSELGGKGNVIFSFTYNDSEKRVDPVMPDTIDMALWKLACGKK